MGFGVAIIGAIREAYQHTNTNRRKTMTKSIITFVLAIAFCCSTVLADDGNMGGSGYTGCDGSNPPPTCTCDPNYPQTCTGFAATQSASAAKVDADLSTIVVDEIGDFVLSVF